MKTYFYIPMSFLMWVFLSALSVFAQSHESVGGATRVHNLGSQVNSKAEDYGGYIIDNEMLYFVSRRKSEKNDHFWMTKKGSADSLWSEPELIKPLNNERSAGGLTIDNSGKIYFATDNKTNLPNDINIWEGKIEGKILNIMMLPSPVNTTKWESQPSVTADGENLFFASNRQSMSGKQVHLFVAHKENDSSWSVPHDLGANVNFGEYNATPFISPDGNFLFFCSNGKTRNLEIYFSTRTGFNDDEWSKAIALPLDINSDADNMFPMIAGDGKTIYFSSNREGGSGGFDIYVSTLPNTIQEMLRKSFGH